MAVPIPEGLTESDYDAIEAAVTETVRGRWFLGEFARRNRAAEMRQLLDAMNRLEASVAGGQAALPSADPSVRLLINRIKEVAKHLDDLAARMREAGLPDDVVEAVSLQARAVGGMMRGGAPPKLPTTATTAARLPRADLPKELAAPAAKPQAAKPPVADATPPPSPAPNEDQRMRALSGLDGLTLDEKLALFS